MDCSLRHRSIGRSSLVRRSAPCMLSSLLRSRGARCAVGTLEASVHCSIKRFGGAFVTAVALSLPGCTLSPITALRIEASMETTFANLVQLQVSTLGLPPMAAADFEVTASCRKLSSGTNGSGDWICNLLWLGPDRRPLRDSYDLFVTTDGCYTAAVEGANLGGPLLKAADGKDVRNLLFTFEGCFDTT